MTRPSICRLLALALIAVAILAWGDVSQASTFTVRNNCSYTIYPGIYPPVYSNGGWTMAPGASVSFSPGAFNGRIWGRTGCNSSSPAQCTTGQCGGTGLQCAGTTGQAGTSLAEFNFKAGATDWYNVSYVDGFDNPIGVSVSNSSCVSPNTCSTAPLTSCPAELRTGGYCLSPCTRYNTDQFCCRGAYGTAATCVVANWPAYGRTYVNNIHTYCPRQYAYAYDEANGSLQTCPTGPNYTITFCPSGGGTPTPTPTPTPVPGGSLVGTRQLSPINNTGQRLDDAGYRLANGNPVVVYQSNGTNAQKWVFATAGVVPAGNYNIAITGGAFCLDDPGSSTTPGAKIQIWTCNGTGAQSWKATAVGGGYYTLSPAAAPGLCLDLPNGATANNTRVQLWNCNGNNAQKWLIQ
jgi:hypothetical protein